MNKIEKNFYIGGMTCINCKKRIERKLGRTAGIFSAEADYRTGKAAVVYDKDVISFKEICSIIEEMDYTAAEHELHGDPTTAVCALVIIASLYVIFDRLGVLNYLVPSRLAENGSGYAALFVVGIITSVHCIAMCGGINLSQSLAKTENDILPPSLLYNVGRVLSYTAVGFVLGLAGMLIGGTAETGLSVFVQGLIKMAAGIFMVISGINMLGIFPQLRKTGIVLPKQLRMKIGTASAKAKAPFIIGLLNGLMPCGPLQSVQLTALASGSPLTGALSMLLFGLGTLPLMLGMGSVFTLLGKKFSSAAVQIGAVLVAVMGLSMLSQGGSLSGLIFPDKLLIIVIGAAIIGIIASLPVPEQTRRLGAASAAAAAAVFLIFGSSPALKSDTTAAARVENGVQYVSSTLSAGSYPSISVQAGIPVRWTINAPKGSINGCNSTMLINELRTEHTFTEGENIIEFTPTEAGEFTYTCWMGMIRGSIKVTEGGGQAISGAVLTGISEAAPVDAQTYSAGLSDRTESTASCCVPADTEDAGTEGCCGDTAGDGDKIVIMGCCGVD